MTAIEYNLLLQCPEWNYKRRTILKRDNFKCIKCSSTQELQVHHTYYYPGKLPWEYTDKSLITLCRTCHELEHINNPPKKRNKRSTGYKKRSNNYDPRIRYVEEVLGRKVQDWEF